LAATVADLQRWREMLEVAAARELPAEYAATGTEYFKGHRQQALRSLRAQATNRHPLDPPNAEGVLKELRENKRHLTVATGEVEQFIRSIGDMCLFEGRTLNELFGSMPQKKVDENAERNGEQRCVYVLSGGVPINVGEQSTETVELDKVGSGVPFSRPRAAATQHGMRDWDVLFQLKHKYAMIVEMLTQAALIVKNAFFEPFLFFRINGTGKATEFFKVKQGVSRLKATAFLIKLIEAVGARVTEARSVAAARR
jgi:hypothetical protein